MRLSDVISQVLREEGRAVSALADTNSENYVTAAEWMVACKGRVITCGIGKSGHIARKTAGTLASTGTPSNFVHAAEAVHGDLGAITSDDVVLLYTQSGETTEIVALFPAFAAIGSRTILITGRPESSAGRLADLVLDTGVRHEACPHDLAPTTSTTVMLALSDALAMGVMDARGFGREDFARFHPSGSLGRRLLLTVSDVMRTGDDLALVIRDTAVLDVMKAITSAGAGAACVVDGEGGLVGFISDGDVRRHFVQSTAPLDGTAADLMNTRVTTIQADLLAVDALESFQNHPIKIGEMPVLDDSGRVVGLLMVKDLLRAGIV